MYTNKMSWELEKRRYCLKECLQLTMEKDHVLLLMPSLRMYTISSLVSDHSIFTMLICFLTSTTLPKAYCIWSIIIDSSEWHGCVHNKARNAAWAVVTKSERYGCLAEDWIYDWLLNYALDHESILITRKFAFDCWDCFKYSKRIISKPKNGSWRWRIHCFGDENEISSC